MSGPQPATKASNRSANCLRLVMPLLHLIHPRTIPRQKVAEGAGVRGHLETRRPPTVWPTMWVRKILCSPIIHFLGFLKLRDAS